MKFETNIIIIIMILETLHGTKPEPCYSHKKCKFARPSSCHASDGGIYVRRRRTIGFMYLRGSIVKRPSVSITSLNLKKCNKNRLLNRMTGDFTVRVVVCSRIFFFFFLSCDFCCRPDTHRRNSWVSMVMAFAPDYYSAVLCTSVMYSVTQAYSWCWCLLVRDFLALSPVHATPQVEGLRKELGMVKDKAKTYISRLNEVMYGRSICRCRDTRLRRCLWFGAEQRLFSTHTVGVVPAR